MASMGQMEQKTLSALALVPAGLVSLGYVLFKRDFAKIHLDLNFLNFPVFIGEILLSFCALLLLYRGIRRPPAFNYYHIFILIYLFWFCFKVIQGYAIWGPLAFRHAALFYYPLFFIFGYTFFNRDLFTKWTMPLLLAVIVLVFIRGGYDRYWTLTLALLGAVLVLRTKEKKSALVMTGVLLLTIPYVSLFKIARMMFVSNIASIMFLMLGVLRIVQVRFYPKLILSAVFALILSGIFYKFFVLGESGRVFVAPFKIMAAFREMDADVQRKKIHYRQEPLDVGLYHAPNAQSRSYHYESRDVIAASVSESAGEAIVSESVAVVSVSENVAAIDRYVAALTKNNIASVEENHIVVSDASLPVPEVSTQESPAVVSDDSAVSTESSTAPVSESVLETAAQESPAVVSDDSAVSTESSTASVSESVLEIAAQESPAVVSDDSAVSTESSVVSVSDQSVKRPEIPLIKWASGKTDKTAADDFEPPVPIEWVSVNNIIFRLFIWRDMLDDWKAEGGPLFGMNFGKPFRSISLEVLEWAKLEWGRDGWIEPHNSFFHMLYRAGIVGLGLITLIVWALVRFIINALRRRSWPLILLAAIMINWLVAANFLLILELPYTAIPFWLIFGMAWAYAYGNDLKTGKVSHEPQR